MSDERRPRDWGALPDGIVPIIIRPTGPSPSVDNELADDYYGVHCNHCGRRVLRRMTHTLNYLDAKDERWCYACYRHGITQNLYSQRWLTPVSLGPTDIIGINTHMPTAPDELFDQIHHHGRRRTPELVGGLDLAGEYEYVPDHLVIQAPRGNGRSRWLEELEAIRTWRPNGVD